MNTIKKITSVIAITLAFFTGSIMGGVQVEARTILTVGTAQSRFIQMEKYVCEQQPRQVKQDINKTMSSFKKKGKKFVPTEESKIRDELEKRFKLDSNKYDYNLRISGYHFQGFVACIVATELYLDYKINKTSKPTFESYDHIRRNIYNRLYGGK